MEVTARWESRGLERSVEFAQALAEVILTNVRRMRDIICAYSYGIGQQWPGFKAMVHQSRLRRN